MNKEKVDTNDHDALGDGLIVVLTHGAKSLSAKASVPKTARGCLVAARKQQKAKRTAKTLAWVLTLEVLHGRRYSPNLYLIRWFFKYGEMTDEDNTVAYLDGACQAMGIDARILRIKGVARIRDRQWAGEVELVFWHEEEVEL